MFIRSPQKWYDGAGGSFALLSYITVSLFDSVSSLSGVRGFVDAQ